VSLRRRWGLRVLAAVLMILSMPLLRAALAAPSDPAAGVTHIVSQGDTLGELALHYGTSTEAIAAANSLADPDVIHVGDTLLIPGPFVALVSSLPEPFSAIQLSSLTPLQGQAWTVRVEAHRPITLTGAFDGHSLLWVPERGAGADPAAYWALGAVHALAAPGPHPLVLEATDAFGLQGRVSIDISVQAGTFDTTRIYLSSSTSELLDPQLVQSEAEELAAIWVQGGADPLWEGQFSRPLRPMWPVSSDFGQRRAYNDGPVSSYHAGVDFSAKRGALVLAPAAGRVVLAEPLTVRGNAVILDHGAGVHTGYWHLWQIFVADGDEIQKGDVLARVGNTGLSTGAHLHWELRVGDVAVDPLQWTLEAMPRTLLTGAD